VVSMTRAELLALPVSFGIDKAGRALGMGRDKSRQLARAGRFPIRVRMHGNTMTCTRHELFRYLSIDDDGQPLAPAGPDAA
jgi:hypothetical protein